MRTLYIRGEVDMVRVGGEDGTVDYKGVYFLLFGSEGDECLPSDKNAALAIKLIFRLDIPVCVEYLFCSFRRREPLTLFASFLIATFLLRDST